MRKLLNLLFLIMVCSVALPSFAGSHDVYFMIDNTSNLYVKHASASSTNPFMSTFNGTVVSGVTTGLKKLSVGNDYLLIGFNDKTAPSRVYVNGSKQSSTTETYNLKGNKATFYRIKLSGSPILVEIYTQNSTPTYTYDLFTEVTDPTGSVSRFANSNGTTYAAPYSGIKFAYGESFTVTTAKAAQDYSLTGEKTTVSQTGSGPFNYSFTPFPHPDGDKPKFSLNIPAMAEYSFTTQIGNDCESSDFNISDYIAEYFRTCPHSENESNLSFTAWGSCQSTFHDGDTYTLVCYAQPSVINLDGVAVPLTQTVENGEETFYCYTFAPTSDGRLDLTFDTQSTGGQTEITESTYTINLKADRSDAIVASVYYNDAPTGETYTLAAGVSTPVTAYSDKGYIMLSLLDTSRYAFTAVTDTNKKENLLQYDIQTDPVRIRSTVTTGEGSGFETNGHTFEISTKDTSNLAHFDMNLNITDDPATVVVKLGSTKNMDSNANRSVNNLRHGQQTIQYTEDDTFLFLSGIDFTKPLYEVVYTPANGADEYAMVVEQGMNPVYRIPLSKAATQGGTVTVTALKPVVAGNCTFTLDVDHAQYIDYLKRHEPVEGSELVNVTDIDLSTLVDGANVLDFNEGDKYSFHVTKSPETATYAGTAIEPWNDIYEFKPTDGGTFTLRFGEEQEVVRPTFTVLTDAPGSISHLMNWDTEETFYFEDEVTTIPFTDATDEMRLYLKTDANKELTFNGNELQSSGVYYSFRPVEGAELHIFFQGEVEVPVDYFTVIIDDISQIKGFIEVNNFDDEGEIADYELEVGENQIPVGGGNFCIYAKSMAVSADIDGEELSFAAKTYSFTAKPGSVVTIRYKANPSYTLLVDDPTKLAAYANATTDESLLSTLVSGYNKVDFANGQSFTLTTREGIEPLVISLEGEDLEADENGTYTYAPADGDVLVLLFNYIPEISEGTELCTVKASFVNEGTEGVMNYVWIGEGAPTREDCDIFLGGVLVAKGTEVGFNYWNDKYIINNITVNDAPRANTGAFFFTVNKNTEVVFDVTVPATINYTITVDDPADIVVYYGNVLNENTLIELNAEAEGDTTYSLTTTELKPQISIAPANEVLINSISTADGTEFAAGENRIYTIDLTDGMALTVDTEAVTFDETFIICIDINSGEEFAGMEETGVITNALKNRSMQLQPGRNVIKFNSRYDESFLYGFATMPENMHTYVGTEEIQTALELLNMFYIITPQDGDIIRTYYDNDIKPLTDEDGEVLTDEDGHAVFPEGCEPEQHKVEFAFDDNLDETNDEGMPIIIIKREGMQDIDWTENSTELTGTCFYVYALIGYNNIQVKLNGDNENARHKAPAKAAAYAQEGAEAPEGYYLVTSLPIEQSGTVNISYGTATGVEDVAAAADGCADVYNLQGIKVKTGVSDLRQLPAGLYIYKGRKVVVR